MHGTKTCPVSNTLKILGKKWTINIINDLLFGASRFNELIEINSGLTPKVLSDRLKELEENGIISKDVTSVTPILIQYNLTKKGRQIRRINFELAMFSAINDPQIVLEDPEMPMEKIIETFGKAYQFSDSVIILFKEMYKIEEKPVIS